jgi:hypothetical protein
MLLMRHCFVPLCAFCYCILSRLRDKVRICFIELFSPRFVVDKWFIWGICHCGFRFYKKERQKNVFLMYDLYEKRVYSFPVLYKQMKPPCFPILFSKLRDHWLHTHSYLMFIPFLLTDWHKQHNRMLKFHREAVAFCTHSLLAAFFESYCDWTR